MLIKYSDGKPVVPCCGGNNLIPYEPDQLISLCKYAEIGYAKGILQYGFIKHKVDRHPTKMITSGVRPDFIVLVYDKYFCIFFRDSKVSISYYMQPESDFMVYSTPDEQTQRIINDRKIYEIHEGSIEFLGSVKPGRTIIFLSDERQVYFKKLSVYEKEDFGKKSKKMKFSTYEIDDHYLCEIYDRYEEISGAVLDKNSEFIGLCNANPEFVDRIEHDDQHIIITSGNGSQVVYSRYDGFFDNYVRLPEKDSVDVKK